MATIIDGIDGLKAKVGEHLGYSDYVEITQEQVNLFADATGDHQWIHVDVERAKAGPFGGPIAHGYLTLSLGPGLLPQIMRVNGVAMGVNYGANKVRFPSPGAGRLQGCASAPSCWRRGRRRRRAGTIELTFEVEGAPKPLVRRRGRSSATTSDAGASEGDGTARGGSAELGHDLGGQQRRASRVSG